MQKRSFAKGSKRSLPTRRLDHDVDPQPPH
jgi:hypothetical protein